MNAKACNRQLSKERVKSVSSFEITNSINPSNSEKLCTKLASLYSDLNNNEVQIPKSKSNLLWIDNKFSNLNIQDNLNLQKPEINIWLNGKKNFLNEDHLFNNLKGLIAPPQLSYFILKYSAVCEIFKMLYK